MRRQLPVSVLCRLFVCLFVCLSPEIEGNRVLQVDGGQTRRRKRIFYLSWASNHHLPAAHEPQHGDTHTHTEHTHFTQCKQTSYTVSLCVDALHLWVCVFVLQQSGIEFDTKTRLMEPPQPQVRNTWNFSWIKKLWPSNHFVFVVLVWRVWSDSADRIRIFSADCLSNKRLKNLVEHQRHSKITSLWIFKHETFPP